MNTDIESFFNSDSPNGNLRTRTYNLFIALILILLFQYIQTLIRLGDPPYLYDSISNVIKYYSIYDRIKEVNVESYSHVAEIGQILKDLEFPAAKDKILDFIRDKITPVNKERIYSALSKIEDKENKNVSDVTTASGLVY